MGQRVRERIPTPENENRLNANAAAHHSHNPFSGIPSIASGVALTAQQLATTPSIFPSSNNVPILGTLLLSPIKESDSVNNTLSSGSLTTNKSILPLNIKSNTQFGSLVIPTNQDHESGTTNSFVVIPATSANTETEIIPVSITTVPLTISSTHASSSVSSGAIITELPFDHVDSSMKNSAPATPRLGNFFSDHSSSPILSPALRHKIQRQQSVESNRSTTANLDNVSNVSASSNSTLSKRPAGGGNGTKHSEVYV